MAASLAAILKTYNRNIFKCKHQNAQFSQYFLTKFICIFVYLSHNSAISNVIKSQNLHIREAFWLVNSRPGVE